MVSGLFLLLHYSSLRDLKALYRHKSHSAIHVLSSTDGEGSHTRSVCSPSSFNQSNQTNQTTDLLISG